MTTKLRQLAEPFPERFVHSNPSGGGSYVKHHVVVQRLLAIVGPYDFKVVELIRGDVAEIPPNPEGKSKRAKAGAPALTGVVVGAVCRLTVTIAGTKYEIEEVGDCEEPHNWPHDGARGKDAVSDAIKRCAARLGLGLHLWSQDEYFLPGLLDDQTKSPRPEPAGNGPRPTDDSPPFDAPGTIRDDQMAAISAGLVGDSAQDTLAKILDWAKADKLEALSASQADVVIGRMQANAA